MIVSKVVCIKSLIKELERNGLSHEEAVVEAWMADYQLSEEVPHFDKGNMDDRRRLKEVGLQDKKKAFGGGQWGPKTESCIKGNVAKGIQKSTAVGMCRKRNKDA